MNYGLRLKQLRKDKSMKQSDVAAMLDVSPAAVGSYERCERQPTFEKLCEYSRIFNVSIDYILCNSDEKMTVDAYRSVETFELKDLLNNHSVMINGKELSEADKARILDVAFALLFS